MTSVRRTASALLAVPLLALGGCSGEEPEPIMPTKSASSTPSASEPSPTPQPWEMKTDDGAVAFVEHWFGLFNRARLKGETATLMEVSTSGCRTCKFFADLATRLNRPGAVYESGPWRLLQLSEPRRVAEDTIITVHLRFPRDRIRHAGEEKWTHTAGGRQTLATRIRWFGDRWLMNEVVVVQ